MSSPTDWAKMQMMRWLAGVLTVVALVAAGCGGTTGAGVGAADIVPASAPAFIAVNTDTDSPQWQTVDDLASRFPDKEKALKLFREGLNSAGGVKWETDVKPALGPELDIVWLDFDNDGDNFVALMQPRDEAKFEQLLRKGGENVVREKLGDWTVLAEDQAMIDRFRRESGSGDALADRKAFREAMGSYPDEWLFTAYVDGEALMKIARRESANDPDFKKIFPKLGRLDWFATNLRATSDGIRWDANVHGTPGPAFKGISVTKPFGPALPNEVPKDALAYVSFHGAKGALDKLEENPIFNDVPEIRRYSGVLRRVGLLLQGEDAVYLRPAPSGKIPEITFIAEPAPGTNGMATLDSLLRRYRKQLELPSLPKPTRVAGLPGRVVDAGEVNIYYANVGKRFVITDFPAGIKTLKGNPASLAQSEEYKGALRESGMPAKPQGFLYVDVRGGIDYATRLSNTPLPGEVKRNLRPLRSAVEYAATRPSEIQVTFFLRIK